MSRGTRAHEARDDATGGIPPGLWKDSRAVLPRL